MLRRFFYLVPAWALAGLRVALVGQGAGGVAVAGLRAEHREPEVERHQLVAAQPEDALAAEALPGQVAAGRVHGADGVAVARLAAHVAVDVPEAVLALLAVVPHHVGLAGALARDAVTLGQLVLVRVEGAEGVALARRAVLRVADVARRERVAVEARLALLAVEARGVVNTAETLARGAVAVADGAQVDVSGAFALPAPITSSV